MRFVSLRRFFSKISIRLLAFNVLLVFIPAAGLSYLTVFERKLLEAQEQSMVQQGRLFAAALSERGQLAPAEVESILVRLEQQTSSRIRVLEAEGWLIADTSRLGPLRGSGGEVDEPDRPDPRSSSLYRIGSSLFRAFAGLLSEPRVVVAEDYYAVDRPFDGEEVRQAMEGRYGASTRITPGGQRSVTLYSALPIRNEGDVVGVVLVSQSTFQILQDLYEVRLAVFEVVLVSVGVAVVLSLLVSATISRPLKRLRSQAHSLLDRRGRLRGRFRGSRRLDEIGELSRSLSELSARLEERMAFIESFAADVSHEFRNPLTSIRAASEMLSEVDDPAERRRFLEVIQADVARLEKLLAAVREISQLDAPVAEAEAEEERRPVVLNEMLEAMASADLYRKGAAGVELSLPAERVVVEADADKLVRVFENLLDNAVGFSPPGAVVKLRLTAENGDAVVRVEDDGPGVPAEHRERIFQRFFSYRPEQENARAHSGLGLAIVKAILERYGGSIRIVQAQRQADDSDRASSGARFEVRLRRRAAT